MIDILQNDPEVPAGVFGELLDEWRVPFRILRPDAGEPLPGKAYAVIVLGGIMGVHDVDRHPFLKPVKAFMTRMLQAGTPLFGICLGGQLLAEVAGGVVSSNCRGERGLIEINLTAAGLADPLFAGVPPCFQAFQWHHDSFTIPPGGLHLAASAGCDGQSFRVGNAWGVQFHPEVDSAIVAAWSGRTAAAEKTLAEFSAAEPLHRALARQLLANFLAFAGSPGD